MITREAERCRRIVANLLDFARQSKVLLAETDLHELLRETLDLVEKHEVRGILAFSRESFGRQFQVPGASLFTATYKGRLVGAALSYQQGDVVYAHLASFSEVGYDLSAAYGLKWVQLDYYRDKARWFDLGGVPGTGGADSGDGGLRQFKRGWSPETKMVYLCGCIFDPQKYAALFQESGAAHQDYFPAYRTGEFE